MYKIKNSGTTFEIIFFQNDNGSITSFPFDPDNTDYQAYLAWVAQGNTPLPADEAQS